MRLKGLDLNLFVVFDALMETRSTSRAAERIGISQPAASAALGRLREYFGDELLVVQGKRMYPTPLAESLLPEVRACLRSAESVLSMPVEFAPERSDRLFRVNASDYVAATILAPLARHLAQAAPGVRIHVSLSDEHAEGRLRRGEIDLLVTPAEWAVAGFPAEPLYEEEFVLAGWLDNPIFASPITAEDVLAHGHVAVSVGGPRITAVGDKQLELLGYSRRIDIVAPSFVVVPWLLIGTMRLALMHRRLAHDAARHFPLAYADLPFALPPLRQLAQYHETRATDAGLRWLIDQIGYFAAVILQE
ncbi:LysR family transcriptional regulator [Novosphingobium flavum]|uniref:LysR family transcriptional regulator n=1 Tax=Novosphingobium flavum TaxID=1778672 RepID=A0A7X1KK49_9SPHN|nr:LysR family transcriptional regulator [Novosphingobium flavum]